MYDLLHVNLYTFFYKFNSQTDELIKFRPFTIDWSTNIVFNNYKKYPQQVI